MFDDEILVTNFKSRPSLTRRLDANPRLLPSACAALGLLAALIHAFVVREHLAHWWGYGAFFAAVAVAQAAAAVLLHGGPSRRLLAGVATANAALIGLYIVSRTEGTPFLGPHAGHAEPVGAIDLGATIAEAVQAALAVALLRHGSIPAGRRLPIRAMAVALAATSAMAWTAPVGRVHVPPLAGVSVPPGAEPPAADHVMTLLSADEPIVDEPAGDPAAGEPTHAAPCSPQAAGSAIDDGQPGTARAILYANEGDLWLATMADGKVHRLSVDGFDCHEATPAFRDDETITFHSDQIIYNLDLRTGDLDAILEDPGGVGAFAWSPDRSVLAYFTWGTAKEPPSLKAYTPATGVSRRVASLTAGGGRCGGMDDEMAISWSRDGTRIMLVATYLDFSGETMFVVDSTTGKDAVAPRMGTHARWMPAGNTVVYREFDGQRRWFSLDVGTGTRTALAMKPGTHHATVSPDGRMIATSDEAESPALNLYDIAGGKERVLTRGYAAAIWLSSDELAATKTTSCSGGGMECHSMWMGAGETAAFDLTGKRTRSLPMATTMDATVLFTPGSAPTPPPAPAPSSAPPTPSPAPTASPSPEPPLLPLSTPSSSPDPTPAPTPSGEPSTSPTPSPAPAPTS